MFQSMQDLEEQRTLGWCSNDEMAQRPGRNYGTWYSPEWHAC
ncbi:hypothetical protein [Nostoc sp.]